MPDSYTTIQANIATILHLDPESFPSLTSFLKRTTLLYHLLQYLTYMADHPYPVVVDHSGRGYWKIPITYMRTMYGGTAESWQSHTVFLILLGLLGRIRPSSKSVNPAFKEEYRKAIETDRRPASFFFIEEYTSEALAYAERQATRYREAGVSVSHLTKTDVIRMEGKEKADLLYMDMRDISVQEARIRQRILSSIADQIQKHGYATPDRIEAAVCYGMMWEERQIYDKLMHHKKALAYEVNCEYRPPRKDDKERFGLDNAGWIMVEK